MGGTRMAIRERAHLASQRVLAWIAHDGGKQSVFSWLVAPFFITAIAFSILFLFPGDRGAHLVYVTLYPAVIVSSLIGGYRAGILAAVLSISGTLVIDQLQGPPDIVWVLLFGFDCLLIVAVCQAMVIAARRAAEARAEARHAFQLLEGEQLFRSFVEHAPAALAMFDKDMRYIGASRRWMSDFGIDRMVVEDRRHAEMLPTMPGAWSQVKDCALAGEIFRKEEDLIVHPDGRQQWLRWEIRPWGDASGNVAGIVIFCEDISLQKQAASAAAESEARLRTIIESMQGSMIVTDAGGNIESFNSATVALFGYSEQELLGSNISQLITNLGNGEERPGLSGEDPDDDEDRFVDSSREVEGRRKGGEAFPVDQMATQWTGVDGEQHWTVIVRDISERRAGEEELGRALRMEAIGRLAGGIAHDFNNLLSVITGNLELAEPQIAPGKAHTMVQKALGAAQRGAGFTQQLLTLAKKRQTEFSEVDINQHISNIAVLLEHTLGSNIRLHISLEPDLWLTRADPVEIDSAIINLAMNAGHAMPGGGTLHISTRNVTIGRDRARARAAERAGEFALLSVRDSGVGMTREVRRRAFEPFFTTKEEGSGTGLGLSSVYSFAQAAGGFVTLDSAVGKGTTVEMYIPRFAREERRRGVRKTATPRQRGHGEIILVVEDDEDVREVSIERLKRLGYATLAAGSMAEACDILRENAQIALVFSDIVLTDSQTGYDLARWVEQHRPDVNILLTTGYDIGDRELAQSKDNPLIRRLEKPHSTAQLADEIRKVLEDDTPQGA